MADPRSVQIVQGSSTTAHHIVTGATVFPYAVDAHSAVGSHPHEWSLTPWTPERADKARAARKAQHDREVEEGVKEPVALIPDAVELEPEEQTALDEHTQAQREAAKRLEAYEAKEAEQRKIEEQVAADRALIAQPPPTPDPNIRRPFGRKGEPTEKEREMLAKRAQANQTNQPQVQGPVETAYHD